MNSAALAQTPASTSSPVNAATPARRERLPFGDNEEALDVGTDVGHLTIGHSGSHNEGRPRGQEPLHECLGLLKLARALGHQPQCVGASTDQRLNDRGTEQRGDQTTTEKELRGALRERAHERLPGSDGEKPVVGSDRERDALDPTGQRDARFGRQDKTRRVVRLRRVERNP